MVTDYTIRNGKKEQGWSFQQLINRQRSFETCHLPFATFIVGALRPETPNSSFLIPHWETEFPASLPVENAICRLKPPVYASTSITSPAK